MPKDKPILLNRGRARVKRPKTFKSEEALKTYAKANGIDKYTIVNLRVNDKVKPKFKIVTE